MLDGKCKNITPKKGKSNAQRCSPLWKYKMAQSVISAITYCPTVFRRLALIHEVVMKVSPLSRAGGYFKSFRRYLGLPIPAVSIPWPRKMARLLQRHHGNWTPVQRIVLCNESSLLFIYRFIYFVVVLAPTIVVWLFLFLVLFRLVPIAPVVI